MSVSFKLMERHLSLNKSTCDKTIPLLDIKALPSFFGLGGTQPSPV
jgi:hypothetical protein